MGSIRRLRGVFCFGVFSQVLACGGDKVDEACPHTCPEGGQQLVIMARSPSGESAVSNFQVKLSGPVMVELACAGSICYWSPGGAIAGTYTGVFTADGYQTLTRTIVVSAHSDCRCGPAWMTVDPQWVVLEPL